MAFKVLKVPRALPLTSRTLIGECRSTWADRTGGAHPLFQVRGACGGVKSQQRVRRCSMVSTIVTGGAVALRFLCSLVRAVFATRARPWRNGSLRTKIAGLAESTPFGPSVFRCICLGAGGAEMAFRTLLVGLGQAWSGAGPSRETGKAGSNATRPRQRVECPFFALLSCFTRGAILSLRHAQQC